MSSQASWFSQSPNTSSKYHRTFTLPAHRSIIGLSLFPSLDSTAQANLATPSKIKFSNATSPSLQPRGIHASQKGYGTPRRLIGSRTALLNLRRDVKKVVLKHEKEPKNRNAMRVPHS